jgi:hypothetical protein
MNAGCKMAPNSWQQSTANQGAILRIVTINWQRWSPDVLAIVILVIPLLIYQLSDRWYGYVDGGRIALEGSEIWLFNGFAVSSLVIAMGLAILGQRQLVKKLMLVAYLILCLFTAFVYLLLITLSAI